MSGEGLLSSDNGRADALGPAEPALSCPDSVGAARTLRHQAPALTAVQVPEPWQPRAPLKPWEQPK